VYVIPTNYTGVNPNSHKASQVFSVVSAVNFNSLYIHTPFFFFIMLNFSFFARVRIERTYTNYTKTPEHRMGVRFECGVVYAKNIHPTYTNYTKHLTREAVYPPNRML